MSEINPYAPPNPSEMDGSVEFEWDVDERALIDAAIAQREMRRIPHDKKLIYVCWAIFLSYFGLLFLAIGLAFARPDLQSWIRPLFIAWPLLLPVVCLSTLAAVMLNNRKHLARFKAESIQEVRELQARYPQVRFGTWKCRINPKVLWLTTPAGEWNWPSAELRWMARSDQRRQLAVFVKTPDFTFAIPQERFSPELFREICDAVVATITPEKVKPKWD